ncbi:MULTISPECIES: hypothetical protein [Thermoactinomyces]|uniref:Uncharacterized protein n=1 Tax=Thermoactinomyces daqus TaxID=1329516 RepID=A0A7W2AJF1_9BACL|nr:MULTISPECIES: hypothetical protein [Thermoactinomyces]MBA4543704.1 hypothetical protein [Thermoactinomyces daqus]MBH8597485.1 hypothetical protein [Thermoactinomyces sp. CICC 10523]MBH8603826.1 hypothetical protein [Thermoactinomyces sp. CICC 10522]MBH8608565.1 hypothetical protein [Thermoactinomyces sp. CICC 10521]
MNKTTPSIRRKHLHEVTLDDCPQLPPFYLFFAEMEQDELYPYLSKEQVPALIEQAIATGERIASLHGKKRPLGSFINHLLKQKVRIKFLEKHSADPSIRAQYIKKPPTIAIYRHSLKQIRQFFQRNGEEVPEEEIWLLHLYHEWFHHLEETKYGRTDKVLPKVTVKQKGPFAIKKPLQCLREIAAHTFTQTVLGLLWSPLLLDHLLTFKNKGWSNGQIREYFGRYKSTIDSLLEEAKKQEGPHDPQDEPLPTEKIM